MGDREIGSAVAVEVGHRDAARVAARRVAADSAERAVAVAEPHHDAGFEVITKSSLPSRLRSPVATCSAPPGNSGPTTNVVAQPGPDGGRVVDVVGSVVVVTGASQEMRSRWHRFQSRARHRFIFFFLKAEHCSVTSGAQVALQTLRGVFAAAGTVTPRRSGSSRARRDAGRTM